MPAKLHTLKAKIVGEKPECFPFRCQLKLVNHDGAVAPGDVVTFPEFFSGAGEFEGIYFAAAPAEGGEGALDLLLGDVEYLCFPKQMVDLVGGADKLEEHFRPALMSADLGGMTLADMEEDMGGKADYWKEVATKDDAGKKDGQPTTEIIYEVEKKRKGSD
ncbi:unnamed protein product [Symbiodinium natans]|uniref:Uncharacterized protein n=1 Tax=Symbiodinium natans TaxID=878477 RepID=A0A812JSP8_9DINO|nr:unnamed protein product [Symbiodinium natans]